MPLTPEQRAREAIDALLTAAGWVVQDMADFNRNGFVGGKAAGVIEAKKAGITLSSVADQAARYLGGLPDHVARRSDIAAEIVENLQAALEAFQSVADELGKGRA